MWLRWPTIGLIGVGLLTACAQPVPTPTATRTATPTPTLAATPAAELPTPTPTPTPIPARSPTPTATSTPTPTPTPSPTPTCLQAPPVERPLNERPQAEGRAGTAFSLDAQLLFGLTESGLTYQWAQLFGTPDEVEYLAGHDAGLLDATSATAAFTPVAPGSYRFRLTTTDSGGTAQQYELDVRVTMDTAKVLDVKGVIYADIFGEMGAPQFNSAPEDPICLAQALDHALSAPVRVGAGWIGLASSAFLVQVSPTPLIGDGGNYLSLTDDDYFAAMVSAAKERGLKTVQIEGLSPGLELSDEQRAAIGPKESESEWWDAWFTEWQRWLVPRAARAEANGVEMFVPYQFAESTFRPEVYPQYSQRWREVLAAIREVYTGVIAMSFVNADERLDFIDAFDAALITVFTGMYTSTHIVADVQDPTMEEAIDVNRFFFGFPQGLIAAETPIYYVLTVTSSDGQLTSEDIEERTNMRVDFQEQALYYEAFFTTVEETPWITGVFTERWDWFDQYARPVDPPGASYFDATLESSPRSKPAEEVVKLWFSIY